MNNRKAIEAVLGCATIATLTRCNDNNNVGQPEAPLTEYLEGVVKAANDGNEQYDVRLITGHKQLKNDINSGKELQEELCKISIYIYNNTKDDAKETAIKYIVKILGKFYEINNFDVCQVIDKISKNNATLAGKISDEMYNIYHIRLGTLFYYTIDQWLSHFPVEEKDGKKYDKFESFTRDLMYLKEGESNKFSKKTIDALLSKFGKFEEFDNNNDIDDNDDLTKHVENFLEHCKYEILPEEKKDNLFKAFSINNNKPNLVAKLSVLLEKNGQGLGGGSTQHLGGHEEQHTQETNKGFHLSKLKPGNYDKWGKYGCKSLSEQDVDGLFNFWGKKGGECDLSNVSSETINKIFTLLNKNEDGTSSNSQKFLKDELFTKVFGAYIEANKSFLPLLKIETLEYFNFGLSETLALLNSVKDETFKFEQKICECLLRNIDTLDEDLLNIIIKKVDNYGEIILNYVDNGSKKIVNDLSSTNVIRGIVKITINNDVDKVKMLKLIGHLKDNSLNSELVDAIVNGGKVSSLNEDFVKKIVSINNSAVVFATINLAENNSVIDGILSKTEANICNLNVWTAIINRIGGSNLGTWIDTSGSLGKFVQVVADDFLKLISDNSALLTPDQLSKVPMLSDSLKNNLKLAFDGKSINPVQKASFLELFKLQNLISSGKYQDIFQTVCDGVTKDITLRGFVNLFQILVKNGLNHSTQKLDVQNKLAKFLCKIEDNELIGCLNKAVSITTDAGKSEDKNFFECCKNIDNTEVKGIIEKLSDSSVNGSLSAKTCKAFNNLIPSNPGGANKIGLGNIANFLMKLPYGDDSTKDTFEKLGKENYIEPMNAVNIKTHLTGHINILTILDREMKFTNKVSLENFLGYISTAFNEIQNNVDHDVLKKFMSFFNSSVEKYKYDDTGAEKSLGYEDMLKTLKVNNGGHPFIWEVDGFRKNNNDILSVFLESLSDGKVDKTTMEAIVNEIDEGNLGEAFDIKKIWELFNNKIKDYPAKANGLKKLLGIMINKHLNAAGLGKRVFKEFSLSDNSLDEDLVKCLIHSFLDQAIGTSADEKADNFFVELNEFVKVATGECATEKIIEALLTYPGDLVADKVKYDGGDSENKAKLVFCVLRGICLGLNDGSNNNLAKAFYERGNWQSVCSFALNLTVNPDFITRIKAAVKAYDPNKYMVHICQLLHGLFGRKDLCYNVNKNEPIDNFVFTFNSKSVDNSSILPKLEIKSVIAMAFWQNFVTGCPVKSDSTIDPTIGKSIDPACRYGNTLFSSNITLLKQVLNLLYKHNDLNDDDMVDVRMLFMASYFAQPKPTLGAVNGWTSDNWFRLVNDIVPISSFKTGKAACPFLSDICSVNQNKYKVKNNKGNVEVNAVHYDECTATDDPKIFKIYAASCEFCGRDNVRNMRALGLLFSLSENPTLSSNLFNEIVNADEGTYENYCKEEIDYVLFALSSSDIISGVQYEDICKDDTLAKILIKFCYYYGEYLCLANKKGGTRLDNAIDLLKQIGYITEAGILKLFAKNSKYEFGKFIIKNLHGKNISDLVELNRQSLGIGEKVVPGFVFNTKTWEGKVDKSAVEHPVKTGDLLMLQFKRPGRNKFDLAEVK